MKKFIAIICVLPLLTIVSCKKDEKEVVVEKTTLEKIQAKWGLENITFKYTISSIPFDTTAIYNGISSDYFDFRTDGKAYISVDGEPDTSVYALSGDSTILFEEFGTYQIQALTDNSLKLFTRDQDEDEIAEQTINLKK